MVNKDTAYNNLAGCIDDAAQLYLDHLILDVRDFGGGTTSAHLSVAILAVELMHARFPPG